jgi:hypothetical protein
MLIFAAFWPQWEATPTTYLHWLQVSPGVVSLRQRYSDGIWRDVETVTTE